MRIDKILPQIEQPIIYYKTIVEFLGSLNAAVFLCYFAFLDERGENSVVIAKTSKEIEDDTGLTIKQQKTARKILKERGYLKEELRGIPATIHYIFDWDKFNNDLINFINKKVLRNFEKMFL